MPTAHVHAPSFINLNALGPMAVGYKIADAVVILGAIDIVLGEVGPLKRIGPTENTVCKGKQRQELPAGNLKLLFPAFFVLLDKPLRFSAFASYGWTFGRGVCI